MRRIIECAAAIGILLATAPSASSEVIFRSTAQVIEAPVPKADLSPTTATSSVVSGTSPAAPAVFYLTNSGRTTLRISSIALLNQASSTASTDFAIVAGGTCAVGQAVAVSTGCTIQAARTAASDDATGRTAILSVGYGGATQATASLSGTAAGFAASLSFASTATASTTNGVSPGPSTLVAVKNVGKTTSAAVSFALATGTDKFALGGGTCVSGSTTLAPGAECSIGFARKATDNDTSATGSIAVSMGAATSGTIQVSGSASGFSTCSTVGMRCPDNSYYGGMYYGLKLFFVWGDIYTNWNSANASCQAKGLNMVSRGMVVTMKDGLYKSGTNAGNTAYLNGWTTDSAGGGYYYYYQFDGTTLYSDAGHPPSASWTAVCYKFG